MSKLRRFRIIGLVVAAAVGGVLTAASASAISGGTPAADGTYGFVAKISMDGRACTGALLNPEYVITSADCFPENPQGGAPAKATTATVGRTNLAGTSGHVVKVTNLVTRADRGVVLAKLDTLITDVTPIALGTTAAANGESLRVAGYGRTNNEWVPDWLHTATMSVASSTPTTFALTGDVDTCKGDSGGPAFRETNGRAELVGINSTSWQHGCLTVTETRQGSTETRTDDIAGWINQQIQPQTVSLKNHYTGRCLAVQGGNNVNEAGAFQYDCAPKFPDRVWKIEPVDGGVQIRNQFTQRCLTVLASNNVNEAPAYQYDCDAHYTDRVWQVEPVDGGVQIRNQFTQRCLTVLAANNVNGAVAYQYDCDARYTDRVWEIAPTYIDPVTTGQIRNHYTQRCLTVLASNNVNEAPAYQYDCDARYTDRAWEIEAVDGGVQIRNHYTRRCLTVLASNNVNEAPAYQYDCDAHYTDRVWEIEPVDGGVQIRNHYTKRCLTVLASNNVNEARAYQYDCDAHYADRVWQIEPVTGAF